MSATPHAVAHYQDLAVQAEALRIAVAAGQRAKQYTCRFRRRRAARRR
jgi:thiazole synthase ThiGH ThiG subunit